MAKISLRDVVSGYGNTSILNANNSDLESTINNKVLFRDNPEGEANQMENDLDMNSFQIINAADATTSSGLVTYSQAVSLAGSGSGGGGGIVDVVEVSENTTLNKIAHNFSVLVVTGSSSKTITLPSGEFAVGDEVQVMNDLSSGSITVQSGGSATMVSRGDYDTIYQYGVVRAKLIREDEWVVTGDIESGD